MPFEVPLDEPGVVRTIRLLVRRWWSVEIAVADATGFVVDHRRGIVVPPHNPLCQSCLHSKDGFAACNRSVERALGRVDKDVGGAQLCGPCHLGLEIVAAPVRVDGAFAGALFACGFRMPGAGEEQQRSTACHKARQLGLDREISDLGEAFARVARVDPGHLSYLLDLLGTAADEASEQASLLRRREERSAASKADGTATPFAAIVGRSPAMKSLLSVLERVVQSQSTVLVTGENGTGKELIARALHFGGPRAGRPFVAQNCSALNDNLLESELFGHVRGSFTGAVRDKQGLFKVADGGTFFLDEVGDMSPSMQVKMLRVLQEGTFLPVGGTVPDHADVRVIAATNRPLRDMIPRREFREDLYYRLNVINVEVPPLRERLEDLPLLCEHFLQRFADRTGTPRKRIAPELMAQLYAKRWPGNIRELENTVERLAVLAGDAEVIAAELRALGTADAGAERSFARFRERGDLESAVQALEREMIETGLIQTHWNKSKLAEKLGMSRTTLIKKIRDYGLEEAARRPRGEG